MMDGHKSCPMEDTDYVRGDVAMFGPRHSCIRAIFVDGISGILVDGAPPVFVDGPASALRYSWSAISP